MNKQINKFVDKVNRMKKNIKMSTRKIRRNYCRKFTKFRFKLSRIND